MTTIKSYTCFAGQQRIADGDWKRVSIAAQQALQSGADGSVLIFDDTTGRLADIEAVSPSPTESSEIRGRGRPKLGVTPREVTLLPRHWEWLAAQPGGTSVTLRRLVEAARRSQPDKDRARKAQERTYAFISAVAGDFIDFEEASRALFANDIPLFGTYIQQWPVDIRDYALSLASTDEVPVAE